MMKVDEFHMSNTFKIWQPYKVSDPHERALVHAEGYACVGRPIHHKDGWATVGPYWVKVTRDRPPESNSYPVVKDITQADPGRPDFYAYCWDHKTQKASNIAAVWVADDGKRWVVVAPAVT